MTTDAGGAPGVGADRSWRLTEVSRALTYARSLQEVLDLTVACAADLLHVTRVVLMLTEADDLLHVRAHRGLDEGQVARFREPLDENLLERLSGLLGQDARDGFLGGPLVVRGQVIGLLGVVARSESAVEQEEWLLSALADQAAVALESSRHQEARAALEGRLGDLERQRVEKDQALEILSHDLRSPLNAILGYAALLGGEVLGPINDRQREAVQRLRSVGEHIGAVLTNVLEMARLTGGRVQVGWKPVVVEDVVRDAVNIVRPAAEDATIHVTCEGDAVDTLRSDPDKVVLVLVQLLDNAVKYSPDDSTVRVRWGQATGEAEAGVSITVADEGRGVPPEDRAAIFEPYVRADGTSARARSGVGLGLAIARGLVERLGGSLALVDGPGTGAVFRIYLPLEPHHEDVSGAPAPEA